MSSGRGGQSSYPRRKTRQDLHVSGARLVTKEEAQELIRKHSHDLGPMPARNVPPVPGVRPPGVFGDDGKLYMVPFETKEGNNERNVPLPPRSTKYDLSKIIRNELQTEKLMMEHIRASFYARSYKDLENETPLPFNRTFLVIHFGIYCLNYQGAHTGEFAIAAFSIRDGISQCYGRMLDPGEIPFGFRSDFYSASAERGYEHPGFDPAMDFGKDCLDVIEKFLEMCTSADEPHGILYTARPEVNAVKDALKFVAKKTGRELNFRVFPMSRLLELLLVEGDQLRAINLIEPTSSVFSEENTIALMVDGKWNDHKELACKFHKHSSKLEFLNYCSMYLVKRWIYNSMELLAKLYCCPMYLHNHIPKLDPPMKLTIQTAGSRDYSVIDCSVIDYSEADHEKRGSASMMVENTASDAPTSSLVSCPWLSLAQIPSSPGQASSAVTAPIFGRGRGRGRGRIGGPTATPPQFNLFPSAAPSTVSGFTSSGDERARRAKKWVMIGGNQKASNASDVSSGTDQKTERPQGQPSEPSVDPNPSFVPTAAVQVTTKEADIPTIVEDEEELPIEETYVTYENYPNLQTAVPLPTIERAMVVSQMPDLKQRKFPRMVDGIQLVEHVDGTRRSAFQKPDPNQTVQPTTTLKLTTKSERRPLFADFSFQRYKQKKDKKVPPAQDGSEDQQEHAEDGLECESRAESVGSGLTTISYDSTLSSVSHSGPKRDPLRKEGMKQARHLLHHPVLPQTQFVYTGKLFWEDENFRPKKTTTVQIPPAPAPPGGYIVGRGHGHGPVQPPGAEQPAQRIGLDEDTEFWKKLQRLGRGSGRNRLPSMIESGHVLNLGQLESFCATEDEDETGTINSAMDQRRDVDYYKELTVAKGRGRGQRK